MDICVLLPSHIPSQYLPTSRHSMDHPHVSSRFRLACTAFLRPPSNWSTTLHHLVDTNNSRLKSPPVSVVYESKSSYVMVHHFS